MISHSSGITKEDLKLISAICNFYKFTSILVRIHNLSLGQDRRFVISNCVFRRRCLCHWKIQCLINEK